VKYEKIVTMKDTRTYKFTIVLTGNFKGNWAQTEVEVTKTIEDCGSGPLINKFKGWFKFLDDKGYPNIWYNPMGC
jgi:hypothetical protein